MHIAFLEDDPDQQALTGLWLESAGYSYRAFATVADMITGLGKESFDLLLLDWMLPDGSGREVLDWARSHLGWDVAIVVLTAVEEESVVVGALQAGADDYLVKPPRQGVLAARLAAAVRRARPGGPQVLRMGDYEVDIPRHQLTVAGQPITLTQKEFDLAVYLFQSPARLLSRDHLLNKIWGINADVDTRTVDTHVSRLRRKLALDGARGWKMTSIYGYGYRLDRVDAPG